MLKWWTIIAILVGVALASGLLLGLLGELLGLSPTVRTVGVGVIVGVTAATLIARKQEAASNNHKNH